MPMPVWDSSPETAPGIAVPGDKKRSTGVLKDFWCFVLRPQNEKVGFSLPVKILNLVKLYFFALLMMIPLGILIFVCCFFLGIEPPDLDLPPSFGTVVLLIGILSLLEELVFRLPLRFTPLNLAFTFGTIAFIVSGLLLDPLGLPVLVFWAAVLGIGGAVIGLTFPALRGPKVQPVIAGVYRRHFATLFYTVNLLFALLHIFNYDYHPRLWLGALVLITPQLLGGLVLSYLRIRQGFLWSTIYHIIWNYLFIVPMYGFPVLGLSLILLLLFAGLGAKIVIMYGRANRLASGEYRENADRSLLDVDS
ncbi:MAG TPA: hypothetical protein GX391_05010 [Firmicutes bacterium]|jgi:hypothetical protein|nr:hypothetical protein [Bacillota bacterium]HOQ23598.1 hypothetical protein [Bacillota bacterium]HPT67229.1 hypothetical protein [Bacillota bacterium]